MFRKIRESQPGPTDPRPAPPALEPEVPDDHDAAPRGDLMARREDRPVRQEYGFIAVPTGLGRAPPGPDTGAGERKPADGGEC